MRASATTALLLALGVLPCAESSRGKLRVSPELHPKSDKKFFGKDYPDDLRPSVKDHFGYPFPIVQESHDYDKDYVKDENNDGGEWKAQSDYDHLRTKLSNLKSDAEHSKKAEDEKEKAEAEAEKKLKEAEEKAKAAQEAAETANGTATAAKEALEKHATNGTHGAGDAANGNGTDGAIANGSDGNGSAADAEVEKDEMNLEDCMKQLAEAKDKLKKLQEEKATRQEEHAAALANATKAAEEEAADAGSAAELAEARRAAEEKHERSLKSYEEEKKHLEDLQNKLEEKAKTLRKFRESAMGKAGGLYHDEDHHSGAAAAGALPLLLCLAAASGFTGIRQ